MTVRGPAPTSEDYIQSEQAVIIWDEAHKIEHFIRQADIRTDDPDLGFIVPTPAIPELVEVDPSIFQLAADVARPTLAQEVVYHTPLQIFWPVLKGPMGILMLPMVSLMTGMSDSGNQPKIISEQDVAGYHATILAADDAASLAAWLKQNNYVWTPRAEAWLKPYVAAKWTITAFKLIKAKPSDVTFRTDSKSIITRALRMSFTTDRPFYPYSEPSEKQKARAASPFGRALRVAFLSSSRMRGTIANGVVWPGDLFFAGSAKPSQGSVWTTNDWLTFAKLSDRMELPSTLTYWRDLSNPRPGTADLYFSAAPDQSSFRKSEIDYSLPILHKIDYADPLADAAGLVILFLLPITPFYCALQVIRSSVSPVGQVLKSHLSVSPNRLFGVFGILLGSIYSLSCIVVLYLLNRLSEQMPGRPLPAICQPLPCLILAGIFATVLYCGIRTYQSESTPETARMNRPSWIRYLDYAMAAGSGLVGVSFFLGVIAAFLITMFGSE